MSKGMSPEIIELIAWEISDQLARQDYEALVMRCANTRLTASDLRNAVLEYGRKLESPPKDAYQNLDAIEIKNKVSPTWSVQIPVWTREEGRSDLTLELTVSLVNNLPHIELDDLHVL
ncbi:MAG: hypothetical protein ABL936_04625 [Aestuariivirga sp.]|mgnify:CR=1 FL=1